MDINPLGSIAALTAFLSIWGGHASVRKIEAHTAKLWKPMVIFFFAGLAAEIMASLLANRAVSTVLGITGISLLWDVLELRRQARRVSKGHAPANPHNPRHAALLVEGASRGFETMTTPASKTASEAADGGGQA